MAYSSFRIWSTYCKVRSRGQRIKKTRPLARAGDTMRVGVCKGQDTNSTFVAFLHLPPKLGTSPWRAGGGLLPHASYQVLTFLGFGQNENFAATWSTRGSYVPVSCPKRVLPNDVLSPLNCGWLKALKASHRSSNRAFSLTWNALNSDRFQLLRPGVTTASLSEVPHWSGPGSANDELLKYWFMFPGE